MRLVIETDIGHDPDDFFAITYLIAAGVHVSAILITPGDPDQIAIARLIVRLCGLDIPIGVPSSGRTKPSSGSIHHALLKRYGQPLSDSPDGLAPEVIADVYSPDTELFIIGPVTSVGAYLKDHPSSFKRATMQGGFCPYSIHRPHVIVDKLDGKPHMPTFNLNGDRCAAETFLTVPLSRQMVGKNVCHEVRFNAERFASFASPINRASELFCEAARLYLADHPDKRFHDPTAAVCHLHPEVGTWFDGKTVKAADGWTTVPGNDKVLVDLDHEEMWGWMRRWE